MEWDSIRLREVRVEWENCKMTEGRWRCGAAVPRRKVVNLDPVLRFRLDGMNVRS